MEVCIGTLGEKSIAYISDMPGINPEFMPEGIHKLIALLNQMRLDTVVADEIRALAYHYARRADILNWCTYKCESREIVAKYYDGNEERFTGVDHFAVGIEGYRSEETPESSAELSFRGP